MFKIILCFFLTKEKRYWCPYIFFCRVNSKTKLGEGDWLQQEQIEKPLSPSMNIRLPLGLQFPQLHFAKQKKNVLETNYVQPTIMCSLGLPECPAVSRQFLATICSFCVSAYLNYRDAFYSSLNEDLLDNLASVSRVFSLTLFSKYWDGWHKQLQMDLLAIVRIPPTTFNIHFILRGIFQSHLRFGLLHFFKKNFF